MSDFTAFIGNVIDLDLAVFDDWLAGVRVQDAVLARLHVLHSLERQASLARSAPPAAGASMTPDEGSTSSPDDNATVNASAALSTVPSLIAATSSPPPSRNRALTTLSRASSQFRGIVTRTTAISNGAGGGMTASTSASSLSSSAADDTPRRFRGASGLRGSKLLTEFRRAVTGTASPTSTPNTSAGSLPRASTTAAGVDAVRAAARAQALSLHVVSQYRIFDLIEPYLHRPRAWRTQMVVPVAVRQEVVDRYYGYDDAVVHELLGKKLNTKTRRAVEEAAERCGVRVAAARRVFENVKRVLKRCEDVCEDALAVGGDEIVDAVVDEFGLSRELAYRYACIMYMTTHRLDATKRKLAPFTCHDLLYAAAVFRHLWTTAPDSAGPTAAAAESALANLAQATKGIKSYFLASKDVMDEYRTASGTDLPLATFRSLVRGVVAIGTGLAQPKDWREVLVAMVEKVVEPGLAAVGQKPAELAGVLDALDVRLPLRIGDACEREGYSRLVQGIKLVAVSMAQRLVDGDAADDERPLRVAIAEDVAALKMGGERPAGSAVRESKTDLGQADNEP
ncbi:hypothetical protein AMAG_16755 [Allomyces macrogynus ATCC 38327]|uniref:Uncharacterized protein n=1 Tax=Allomyces macrogynus (strain ATCC 38327) TaxID=578462 RepID=A0A0L0TBS9_ALLM3|nr:hypothetical protein AMAG_16755 [Allomyces macrogynus ATCC 38327]|eukprot:KNE72268.1 hypothetical protein AMAG_16755 [Allomyces macrogynus ATCC 38327]